MAVRRFSCQGKAMTDKDEKTERLAAALRENLKRRKAQARAGQSPSPQSAQRADTGGDEECPR